MDLDSQGVQVADSKSEADRAQAVLTRTQSRECANSGLNLHTDISDCIFCWGVFGYLGVPLVVVVCSDTCS